ncbi:MAG: 50S ribosomal protein L6 [Gemmataceae bacterium]|nr:50S ribosomal protein L6 [Gemmataceae bacterium]
MSRIGKQPVAIPAGVKVKLADGKVTVEKGPLKLETAIHRNVKVELGKLSRQDDKTVFTPDAGGNVLQVTRKDDERLSKSVHGLMRTLINNMVVGVTTGYEKKLKIEGVGYAAKLDKKTVVLTVGFANQIRLEPPVGVTAEVPDANTIIVKGADKQAVGQFAAEVRAARPPEPYAGKGVRYENEVVRRKEGKSFASGG